MIIVSQNKESIINFNNVSSIEIFHYEERNKHEKINKYQIYSHYAEHKFALLGEYETKGRAKEVLKELLQNMNTQKFLLKPKAKLPQEIIKGAKKYFEELNNIDLIVNDENFEIIPVGNNKTIIYEMPPKQEVEE